MMKRYNGACARCGAPAARERKTPVCVDCLAVLSKAELRLWRDRDDPKRIAA